MAADATEIRLRNNEARIDASHQSITKLRDASASHETRISVITTELRETREDIAEVRRELTWIRRGMWGAAAFFATATISGVGVLAVVLSSG